MIWWPTSTSSCLRSFGSVSETRMVSPMPRASSFSKASRRLDDAFRRQAGLGDAEVERHVGARLREARLAATHLVRIGVLERHDEAVEAETSSISSQW